MTGTFACPVDGTRLVPMERAGIEIDHCPTCRGVWLDRGELDKIIERSAVHAAAPTPQPEYRPDPYRGDSRPYPDHDRQSHGGHHGKKRRKSFLEELFD